MRNSIQNAGTALFRHAKRAVIFVIGGTVLLVGVAMIVLPGPAVVVIPAGLAILATEFVWARNLLHKVKEKAMQTKDKIMRKKGNTPNQNDSHQAGTLS
ncbi:MAG TPA: PGPGW domain-containing protein [Bacteroidota bacterium]|nr:PGPGW domain-containing protein [Bacteroidota bacterium]